MALLSSPASQPAPRDRVSGSPLSARAAGRRETLLAVGRGLLLLVAWNVDPAPLAAQEDAESVASREHQIKAAYLYQFGRYVEWPAKAFSSPQAPFVIGVPEHDPLIGDLDQIARIKKVQDRAIQIRRFSSAADVPACNILYLPASLAPEAQAEVIRKAAGQRALLVGDGPGFLERGGIVQFVVEENRIRVVVSRKAAERAGLTISAKLLQVARVVD
ncbi:MAG: YfiR family protein [Planctomycetia bacterium]|nr:YfiR family protein [Planctomycetia bacterium]